VNSNHNNDESKIEKSKFVVLPKAAIDRLLKHERAADLIAQYTFYSYTGAWQGTNQPRATIKFVAKGLHWGRDKVRLVKSLLVGMKLIEDVTRRNPRSGKTEGWFIWVKHFAKLNNHPTDQPEGGLNQRVVSKATNACSSGKGNACSRNKEPLSSLRSERTRSVAGAPSLYSEEEKAVIADYHNIVCDNDPSWKRVNKFSEKVCDAIEYVQARVGSVILGDDLRDLFHLAASGDDSINMPTHRTLVRLLRDNQ
jgi:hypothetical protein